MTLEGRAGWLHPIGVTLFLLTLLCSSPARALSVLVIGDSHTGAIGPQVSSLLRSSGNSVRVVYHNGWSVKSYLERPGGFPHGHPDLAIVLLGGNNRELSLDRYTPLVLSMLRRLGARHVLWVGPFPAEPAHTRSRHQRTRKMQLYVFASRPDVTWLDPSYDFRGIDHVRDGVHYRVPSYSGFSSVLYRYAHFLIQMLEDDLLDDNVL